MATPDDPSDDPSDDPAATPAGFGPDTYGRSFAEVYDDWYPDRLDTVAAVRSIITWCGTGRVLELGVGTGRLSLPLADAGCEVVGLDASDEMLDELRRKDTAGRVTRVLGDVANDTAWPDGPFDLVLAANNLLCNLDDGAAQRSCVEQAARTLRPGGHLVVECFIPAPVDTRSRTLSVRDVEAGSVTLIATDARPGADPRAPGPVTGAHVELRDGQSPRVRSWRIVPVTVAQLDEWCDGAGLEPVARQGDWAAAPYDPSGARHVSVFRRPGL